MINRIIIIGRLTRDIDLRYTASGLSVAKFTLAVDRRIVKGKEKETDFIDVVVWQKLADACSAYLGKGKLAAIDGRLQIRSYEDKDGVRRKAAEVVAENVRFLSSNNNKNNNDNNSYTDIDFNSDDIPF